MRWGEGPIQHAEQAPKGASVSTLLVGPVVVSDILIELPTERRGRDWRMRGWRQLAVLWGALPSPAQAQQLLTRQRPHREAAHREASGATPRRICRKQHYAKAALTRASCGSGAGRSTARTRARFRTAATRAPARRRRRPATALMRRVGQEHLVPVLQGPACRGRGLQLQRLAKVFAVPCWHPLLDSDHGTEPARPPADAPGWVVPSACDAAWPQQLGAIAATPAVGLRPAAHATQRQLTVAALGRLHNAHALLIPSACFTVSIPVTC